MTGLGPGTTCTVCWAVDCRWPAAWARARSRCTALIKSACCDRKASPSCCVQSSRSFIICNTSGNAASDWTLGSQGEFCMASDSCWSDIWRGCVARQRWASTTSSGYVEAMSTCDSNESGYSAIGATNCSSWAGLRAGGGGASWARGAASGARQTSKAKMRAQAAKSAASRRRNPRKTRPAVATPRPGTRPSALYALIIFICMLHNPATVIRPSGGGTSCGVRGLRPPALRGRAIQPRLRIRPY